MLRATRVCPKLGNSTCHGASLETPVRLAAALVFGLAHGRLWWTKLRPQPRRAMAAGCQVGTGVAEGALWGWASSPCA